MTLTGGNRSPNPALPTTYLTWTDLGLNLGLRGVCPKTNRLNNATAVKGLDLSDIYIYIYIYFRIQFVPRNKRLGYDDQSVNVVRGSNTCHSFIRYRLCAYNVTLRRVRGTIVTVDKQ